MKIQATVATSAASAAGVAAAYLTPRHGLLVGIAAAIVIGALVGLIVALVLRGR